MSHCFSFCEFISMKKLSIGPQSTETILEGISSLIYRTIFHHLFHVGQIGKEQRLVGKLLSSFVLEIIKTSVSFLI